MGESREEYNQILYGNSIVWIIVIPAIAFENVVCLLAISTRKRWKSPDVLLFSLILAHFLTLVLPMLLYAAVLISKSEWVESACKFLVWCFMSFTIVNSLQISFLSMDRVWTLKWPSSYRIHNTAKQSMRTVSFIWIFGLSIGCIPLLGWPDDPSVTSLCSVILNIGGYGYALCIVVIILGSFVVSSACVATILLHLTFQKQTVEGAPAPEFKQPIPEIVIESETGERTSAVQGSRETQNRQICLLVSALVVVEFFTNGIPFVVINIMALQNNSQMAWMPATVVWSALCVTLINPVLLCVICQRYRRSYVKLGMCLGEACGCADSSVQDTTVGGIQRQETIDSLDNFSDADDELGKAASSNFGDLSFSIDMDDEQALEYGITASMEQDIRSLEMAGILCQDSIDFDNEAYIQDESIKKALSSKERRALWLAQKACRRNNPDAHPQGNSEDALPKENPQFLSVDRADSLRNHHRKLERNFRPRDSGQGGAARTGKPSNGEDTGQTMHTVKVEIENGGLNVTKADGGKGDGAKKTTERSKRSSKKQKSVEVREKDEAREKRLRNGGLLGSKSCDVALSTGTRKTKKKRRSSVPQEKEETAYSVKLSPVKGLGEGPSLRSNRFDIVRERMLSEMSSLHGSGELYDIPEEDGEDVQETSFAPEHGKPTDQLPEELIPDNTFEQSSFTPTKTPKSSKKHKKKSKDKRYSRKSFEKSTSIDLEDNPLTQEEEWLKKAIEREESSGRFAFENLSSDTDTTDGANSEYSGYISSRTSSVVSKMSTFPSIDASVEYDMDMIVIEQVNPDREAPCTDEDDQPCACKARVDVAEDEVTQDDEPLASTEGATMQCETLPMHETSQDHASPDDGTGKGSSPISQDSKDSGETESMTKKDAVDLIKTGLTGHLSGESDPWANHTGRPRAYSAGAGRASTAKDMREKYKRSRSERIMLEPINSDSSQEVLYL
ncbi:uncharacterized protein LOC119732606 [Patiria miniata]|uniref:G-protein coupled receptors family 1 profile domain-containing protein n=1 Tax=Patiria miniata TaxID=46514 RepID=A0A914ADV0_PATMI|nr:uncharacterized protein LOC119732606 [Patiria miniata]